MLKPKKDFNFKWCFPMTCSFLNLRTKRNDSFNDLAWLICD